MRTTRFISAIVVRDSDTPCFHDLTLNAPAIARRLAGDPRLERLRHKYHETGAEIVARFTPGVEWHPGQLPSLNAGYDPQHDEGELEAAIWDLLAAEATEWLAPKNQRSIATHKGVAPVP